MAAPFGLITNTVGTLAAGHIVLATEWNTAVGGIYSYINNTLLTAGLNKLITNGDMYYHDGTNLQRLVVGTNGQMLTISGGIPAWSSVVTAAALVNKGDLLSCSGGGVLGALTVGTNGQTLIADSTQTLGVKWADATASVPILGIILWGGVMNAWPSNFQICDGTNGTPNLQGVFVPGSGITGPAAGGLGILAAGATGGVNTHTHSVSLAVALSYAAGALQAATGVVSNVSTANNIPKYTALPYIMRIT